MKNSGSKPNIIFMHSHNTGRFIQPYGHAFPTPNLQRMAEEGVLFRQAFCTAPTCSPSRASFLTGMYPHSCGMLGLAHRGFRMKDYSVHIARVLHNNGYNTALAGVEHIAASPEISGYDRILSAADPNYPDEVPQTEPVDAALRFLGEKHAKPYFLSLGLTETHRPYKPAEPEGHPEEDARYCSVLPGLPDVPEIRQDIADFKASIRKMDHDYGQILRALDSTGQSAHTLVFAFTDHGPEFPGHICNLTDRGIGVYLIVRGPRGFSGGKVIDEMVSLVDLAPTAYDAAGIERPPFVEGHSLEPILSPGTHHPRDSIFAESNYHAAYEPMRCIRTRRYKYIRRYDDRSKPVLPNADDTVAKHILLAEGWKHQPRYREMLYDLVFDSSETCNIAGTSQNLVGELNGRLAKWMEETRDPLLIFGTVPAPTGSVVNSPEDDSPSQPTHTI